MGRGIAQVAAQSGFQVQIWDEQPPVQQAARESIDKNLNREVEKQRLDADQLQPVLGRLSFVEDLEQLKQADIIIEAVREDVETKLGLFRKLEAGLGENVILATNTSSLSVTELSQALARPQRFAGLHFFNPVPRMKLVEIVSGLDTSAEVLDLLESFSRQIGKVPIRVKDSPGFLVNHAGRGYGPEALRILADHISQPWDIDRIMKDLPGFKMGPFELMDLVGLDVAHPVMEQIYNQFYQDPLYGPNVLAQTQMMSGRLGLKTGKGWYTYDKGRAVIPPEKSFAEASPRVWISPQEPELSQNLRACLTPLGTEFDDGAEPAAGSVCLVTPIGADATSTALEQNLDPARTVAVDMLFPIGRRWVLMAPPTVDRDRLDAVAGLFSRDKTPVTVIGDSPGFVAQRIVAQIINIACNIAEKNIGAPADIDVAVKLGLNYPHGPLEWGDLLGPERILRILQSLYDFYNISTYRPSPWLKRRVALGVSLLTTNYDV